MQTHKAILNTIKFSVLLIVILIFPGCFRPVQNYFLRHKQFPWEVFTPDSRFTISGDTSLLIKTPPKSPGHTTIIKPIFIDHNYPYFKISFSIECDFSPNKKPCFVECVLKLDSDPDTGGFVWSQCNLKPSPFLNVKELDYHFELNKIYNAELIFLKIRFENNYKFVKIDHLKIQQFSR